jgi:hypothetical protein
VGEHANHGFSLHAQQMLICWTSAFCACRDDATDTKSAVNSSHQSASLSTADSFACPCTAGEAVLNIQSAEDLRALMRTMVLSEDEWDVGEEWLDRLCQRRPDDSIRMPGDLDDCSRAWHLGAILGDGHIWTTTSGDPDGVVHYMQVGNRSCNRILAACSCCIIRIYRQK